MSFRKVESIKDVVEKHLAPIKILRKEKRNKILKNKRLYGMNIENNYYNFYKPKNITYTYSINIEF